MKHQIQYSEDGSTMWINACDGSNIARFSTKFGIDIHNSATDQINGKPQCLYCTHTKPTNEDLIVFETKVKEYFNIQIDKSKIKI